MKKLLTLLLLSPLALMLFPQNVIAENWVEYIADGDTVWYVETETIKERNGFFYVWKMMDFAEPNSFGNLSVKFYDKLDCDMSRFQRLSYVYYRRSMGMGSPEYEDSDDKKWKNMIPGTADAAGFNFVCPAKDK